MNDPKKPSSNDAGQKRTLVAEETSFKGTLTSSFPILVQGSLEGDVNGPAIGVSATGVLSGKITAPALMSEGRIAGTFDVDTAQLAGTVEKNTVIRASSLELKLTIAKGKMQLVFASGGSKGTVRGS